MLRQLSPVNSFESLQYFALDSRRRDGASLPPPRAADTLQPKVSIITVEKLSVFTKEMESERVIAPSVRLGPRRVEALSVVVRDLSFAGKAMGTRVDAMIGFDFLGKGPFTIDYQSKKIVFGPIDPSLVAMPYQDGSGWRRRAPRSAGSP
jgi:hypothetical protein